MLSAPAGFLAFYLRRQKVWTAIVLVCVCALVAAPGSADLHVFFMTPPSYLLTVLFVLAEIVVFCLAFRDSARSRAVCLVLGLLTFVALFIYSSGLGASSNLYQLDSNQTWTVTADNPNACELTEPSGAITDWTVSMARAGSVTLHCVSDSGQKVDMLVTCAFNTQTNSMTLTFEELK